MDKYLQSLLQEIKTLIFPGLGAITITNEKTGELMFMSYLKFDDGKLAKCMAEKEGMTELDAKNVVGKYVQNIIQTLDKGEKYSMYQFGEFHKDSNGEVQFKTWNSLENVISSSENEILNLAEIQPIEKNNIDQIIHEIDLDESIKEISPVIEFETEPQKEISLDNTEEIKATIPKIDLEIIQPVNEKSTEKIVVIEEDLLFGKKQNLPTFELNSLDEILNNSIKSTANSTTLDDLLENPVVENVKEIKDIPFEIESPTENQTNEINTYEEQELLARVEQIAHKEIESNEKKILIEHVSEVIEPIPSTVYAQEHEVTDKTFDEEYQEKIKAKQGQITVIAARKKRKWVYLVAPLLLLATIYLIGFTQFKSLSKSFPIMEKYAFMFGQKTIADPVKKEPLIKNEDANNILDEAQAIETPDDEIESTPIPETNVNLEHNGNKGDNGTAAYEEPKLIINKENKTPKENKTSSNSGRNYSIIIGSFGNEENAKRLAKKINGEVIGTTSGGLHMVSAASFGSKSEAKNALSGIQVDYSGAYVIKRK
jgi:hypothetical protein